MFMIEVKERETSEKLTFEDIFKEARVFHTDCGGGKVDWRRQHDAHRGEEKWFFACKRCLERVVFDRDRTVSASTRIAATSIDGKRRLVREGSAAEPAVYVTQKKA